MSAITGSLFRKRKLEHDGDETPKKRRNTNTTTLDVKVISPSDLFDTIAPGIKKTTRKSNVVGQLINYQIGADRGLATPLFTPFNSPENPKKVEYSQVWLEIKGEDVSQKESVFIEFTHRQGCYDSEILSKKQHHGVRKTKFDYLTLCEWGDKEPLAKIRCGDHGEILWLKKGVQLSGTYVTTLCLKILEAIPLVKTLYLFDEAKSVLNLTGNKDVKISLSKILSIASIDGKSWYGRFGFTPVKCDNWKRLDGKLVNQDPEKYDQAIKLVRNTRLSELQELYKKYTTRLRLLNKIVIKYFPNDAGTNHTLHTLFHSVHEAWKKNVNPENQSSEDLYTLYKNFLEPIGESTMKSHSYTQALETINTHILWQRTFVI